jgi:ABC-type antimicrobial peptide transport system permease subunit
LDFVEGDPDTAYEQLEQGNAIFISREFHVARGINVGDFIPMKTLGDKTVNFKVVAVVASTGMDMAKNFFDARSTMQDAAVSSVVGSFADGRKYFDVTGASALLVDVSQEAKTGNVLAQIQPRIEALGMSAASSIEMRKGFDDVIGKVINAISLVAVAAMLVASLGVANMVIAAIHGRRFEFGILRAIGAGRGQLVRLVLAEVFLIALGAVLLGTMAGFHMGWMSTEVDRVLVGISSSFPSGWGLLQVVGISLGTTLVLVFLASIVPAIRGAFAAQRELLAAGRS